MHFVWNIHILSEIRVQQIFIEEFYLLNLFSIAFHI